MGADSAIFAEVIIGTDSQRWALRDAWMAHEAQQEAARRGVVAISTAELARLEQLGDGAREAARCAGLVKAVFPGARVVEAREMRR